MTTHPMTERGVGYWIALINEPCPGCGYRGGEGDGVRCGGYTQAPEIDYILCVPCTQIATTLPDDHPEKLALDVKLREYERGSPKR